MEKSFEAKVSEKIDIIVTDAVNSLRNIDDDPYVREAIVKMAIREFVWGIVEYDPSMKSEIADQLSLMSELVSEHRDQVVK